MDTRFPSGQEIARKWFIVDGTGLTLGRLASQVARILSGKESPIYTPFIDTGDHVIVSTTRKVRVPERRRSRRFIAITPASPADCAKKISATALSASRESIVQEAILGMLPKNKLGKAMGKKLKVYKGDKHTHAAQKPEALKLAAPVNRRNGASLKGQPETPRTAKLQS